MAISVSYLDVPFSIFNISKSNSEPFAALKNNLGELMSNATLKSVYSQLKIILARQGRILFICRHGANARL